MQQVNRKEKERELHVGYDDSSNVDNSTELHTKHDTKSCFEH